MATAPVSIANFLRFVECCTGNEIFFRGSLPVVSGGTYQFSGANFPGTGGQLVNGQCYAIYPEYSPLPTPYPIAPPIGQLTLLSDSYAGCKHPSCPDCEPVVENCYLLVPCDGTDPIVSNNQAFEVYLNSFITIITDDFTGCAYVVKLEDTDCDEAVEANPDPDLPCDCDLNCYYIQNSEGFFYVDENNQLVYISALDASPSIKVCSKIPPIFDETTNQYVVINSGNCDEDNHCPTECYKLVNCQNENFVIYTNSSSVLPYLYGQNQIVNIAGQEGCWRVENLDEGEVCECPVDVVITTSYGSCPDCIGYIAYKLISCSSSEVIYTLADLAEYAGKYIKLNCGCYFVELINYLPSNPQTITQLNDIVYSSCPECTRTYWLLEDCADIKDPIITYTDLALYEGKVIKIEGCDECWNVTSTTDFLNAVPVVVTENHVDCIACNINAPCVCTILTNYGDKPKGYIYLDCDKEYQEIILQPGESSDRVCAIAWYTIPYCTCVIIKQTISIDPQNPVTAAFTAYALPNQEINGYPVYELCQGPTCGTISFNGTYWVIYDENEVPLYQLTNNESATCLFGEWQTYGGEPLPAVFKIESYGCPTECNCISLTIDHTGSPTETLEYYISGYDSNGYAIWTSTTINSQIVHSDSCPALECEDCWRLLIDDIDQGVELCHVECPVGRFFPFVDTVYQTTNCTQPVVYPTDFTPTDYFQTFGDCQNGVCLPLTLKNNRTVKPGYNTPGCNPDRYDEITCRFADIMYKIVLEKRYGITNCCPDDDEKWLLKKELIDLQALKDPNYKCPECPCSCSSGKSYSTCNCGN
jgi:hypothetical protein